MKNLLLLFILFGFSQSFSQEIYSKVKIYTTDNQLVKIGEMGICIDHGKRKKNTWFQTDLSKTDLEKLRNIKIDFDVIIKDVSAFYASQNEKTVAFQDDADCGNDKIEGSHIPIDPVNFELGTMGGFFTYEEYLIELDLMQSKYPTLITVRDTIDRFLSHENRPIYWVRISDNPTVDEDEKEVLYTSIHHAREPASLSQTLYYMWYLLENYESNAEIKYLVDNTEMYFVPMINPDGYKRNQTTNPNGGGMHRKNRNPNVGTINKGVDLNRNYGDNWNVSGTSPNVDNDVFAGSGPFSEPESQAIKWFCENHSFQFAFNAHAFGDWILFPIGWSVTVFAEDNDYFESFTENMVQFNGYKNAKVTELYPAAGGSDDWMYSELSDKPKVFAMTPEVGGDDVGFWPPSAAIRELCRETFWQNKTLAHMPHKYIVPSDLEANRIAEPSGYFRLELERFGLEDGDVNVSIVPVTNIATIEGSHIQSLALSEVKKDSFAYTLSAGINFGDEIKYVLKVDNGLWSLTDTLTKFYRLGRVVFSDDCSDLSNWSGDWVFTNETYVSPTRCITESAFTDYNNNQEKECVLDEPIYLKGASYAYARFQAKWEIENDFDYVQFMASTDKGLTWSPLCGKYTNAGAEDQLLDQPLYDGNEKEWVLEEVQLTDYIGEEDLRLRFYFVSDAAVIQDGFYFDDFAIYTDAQFDLGNDELGPTIGWDIKPNPSNTTVEISTQHLKPGSEMMIYDNQGQLISKIIPNENSTTLNIEDWPIGIYNVTIIQFGKVTDTKKLVVTR